MGVTDRAVHSSKVRDSTVFNVFVRFALFSSPLSLTSMRRCDTQVGVARTPAAIPEWGPRFLPSQHLVVHFKLFHAQCSAEGLVLACTLSSPVSRTPFFRGGARVCVFSQLTGDADLPPDSISLEFSALLPAAGPPKPWWSPAL